MRPIVPGARVKEVDHWDRAATVKRRQHVDSRESPDAGPGTSGHHDQRVRSLRFQLSEGVTTSLARGAIKRSVGRPLASS
jgi:hypothetical protein